MRDRHSSPKSEWRFLEGLRDVSLDAIVTALEGIQRLKQVRADLNEDAAEQIGAIQGNRDQKASRGRNLGDFLFDIARLQLHHVDDLLRFARNNAGDLFDLWRKYHGPRGRYGDDPCAEAPLRVRGEIGAHVCTSFDVADRRNCGPDDIEFRASQFRSADGATTKNVKLDFDWAFDPLPPAKWVVQVDFDLHRDEFVVGVRYQGWIYVFVEGKLEKSPVLEVEAYPAPDPDAADYRERRVRKTTAGSSGPKGKRR